jgi:FdhD protein
MNQTDAWARVELTRLRPTAQSRADTRSVATEVPVSITVNGVGHAVMMASPHDLEDFAHGFALTDGIVQRADDVLSVEAHPVPTGILLKLEVTPARFAPFAERVRSVAGASGCGLCGVVNLEQAIRPLPMLSVQPVVQSAGLFRALEALGQYQPLNRETGAVHAAAFCNPAGDILAVREDIGRHNAFDKLIGHLLRERRDPASGFALLTSRCSYELVEKAVLAGLPLLATISAPTTLAIERARDSRLTLFSLARADSMLVAHDPFGQFSSESGSPS